MKLIKFRRMIKNKGVWEVDNFPDNYIDFNIKKIDGTTYTEKRGVYYYEIAWNEEDLKQKLNGDMAEIIMPAKPWYVRLYRKIKNIL